MWYTTWLIWTQNVFERHSDHSLKIEPTLKLFQIKTRSHMCLCMLSRIGLFAHSMDCSLPGLCWWTSPGRNTGRSCHFLPGESFQTKNIESYVFLHRQVDFLPLSHLGSPKRNKLGQKLITVSLTNKDQWIIVCFQQGIFLRRTQLCKAVSWQGCITWNTSLGSMSHGRCLWQYFRIIFISQDSFIHWNLPKHLASNSACILPPNFVLNRPQLWAPSLILSWGV